MNMSRIIARELKLGRNVRREKLNVPKWKKKVLGRERKRFTDMVPGPP